MFLPSPVLYDQGTLARKEFRHARLRAIHCILHVVMSAHTQAVHARQSRKGGLCRSLFARRPHCAGAHTLIVLRVLARTPSLPRQGT